jgi:hypothetical protein
VRNTNVGISERTTRRKALASETLILSMVNLSSPRSSVRDTMRGMYLLDAVAEWKGADESDADAEADTVDDITQ